MIADLLRPMKPRTRGHVVLGDGNVGVRDLVVVYPGGRRAVAGVSLSVPAGGVLGLLGGNGAGKSTTLKVLAGAWPASSGQVSVLGHDVTAGDGGDPARLRIGYCPDVGGLPPALTVRELVGTTLATTGRGHLWPAALELADRLGVTERLDQRTTSFSHGVSRRVSVLLACLASDGVLLLDEPFDGVDPVGSNVIIELVREAAAAGTAVIVSTHQLHLAARACDQAAVMVRGGVRWAGPMSQLAGPRGAARYEAMVSRSAPGSAL